jgi:hypothetical protein
MYSAGLQWAPLGHDHLLRLRDEMGLTERSTRVLMTVLRAFRLIVKDKQGHYHQTNLARTHLEPSGEFDTSDYLELGADARGVTDLVARLKTSRPAGDSPPQIRCVC